MTDITGTTEDESPSHVSRVSHFNSPGTGETTDETTGVLA
jgi:hypothetical protein